MQCFNEYKGDRTCELCSMCNKSEYEICRRTHDKKVEEQNKSNSIGEGCPFRGTGYDEWQRYYTCSKKPSWDDECSPCEDCRRY